MLLLGESDSCPCGFVVMGFDVGRDGIAVALGLRDEEIEDDGAVHFAELAEVAKEKDVCHDGLVSDARGKTLNGCRCLFQALRPGSAMGVRDRVSEPGE